MDLITYLLAAAIGIVAGIVGSITGGGGLISIPALLFLGLPPYTAIATNKFGGIGLILSSSYKYSKAKKVNWELVVPLTIVYLVGSFFGSNTVLLIDEAILSKAVGLFILVILTCLIFKPEIGVTKRKPKNKYLGYFLLLLVGFWGGFFGGGYGIIALYVLTIYFGMPFLLANGTDFIASLAISAMSVTIFALAGVINYGL